MSQIPDDWSDFQAAWRERPGPDRPGLDAVRAQVRREQARMRIEVAAEAAIALFCVVVFLWWATGETGAVRGLMIGLAVVSAVSVAVTGLLRRRVWRAQGETVAAYRRLLLRRARLGLAFARFGYVGGPLGMGGGLLVAETMSGAAAAAAPSMTTAVGVVALATLAVGWVWSLREARRCNALVAALAEEDA